MKVSISRPVVDDRDVQDRQTAKNCKSAYDADRLRMLYTRDSEILQRSGDEQ